MTGPRAGTVKRTFRTFYGVMGEAARWLVSLGVTHVAMEATGIYSMPVYYALLEHGDFGKVLICNAAHVKNVPGRKTDYADAEWLAHLLECRLLAGCFIPPAEIKAARDVIRYRHLCRHRHSLRYAEAWIMPSSRARCRPRVVAAVKTSA